MRGGFLTALVFLLALLTGLPAWAEPMRIVVSVPGPRNISYLPIDLIPKLGMDKAEGVEVRLIHTGGGAVALNNLMTRNAVFAVAGVPAAMSLRANGGDVVVVAPVNDAPLFVLMVRSALKGEVKRIADLKGRVIGVNTSTKSSKTTSQQLAELLLRSGGVSPDTVRIVPAGQSWEEQSSLLLTGTADAVMGDEPFATRLKDEGAVFFLAHLAEAGTAERIPGANFLHAAVATRSDVIREQPEKVEKMVRIVVNTLRWMAHHSPEEVVGRLGVSDPEERDSLLRALKRYPRAYSRDGLFSARQLAETERFFRNTNKEDARAQALTLDDMVEARWAGRKK